MTDPRNISTNGDGAESLFGEKSRERDRGLRESAVSGIVGRLVMSSSGLLTLPLVTHALTREEFGVYAVLTSSSALLAFADLGVGSGLTSVVAIAHSRGRDEEVQELVSNALPPLFLGAGLVLIPGILATYFGIGDWLLSAGRTTAPGARQALAVFVVLTAMSIPATVGQRLLVALQRGREANIWGAAAAVMTVLAAAVASVSGAGLTTFIGVALGVPTVIAGAQCLIVLYCGQACLKPSRSKISPPSVVALVKIGGLYLVLNLAIAFAYSTDTLVVSGVRGVVSAGIFAVALRFFGLISGLATAATQQLWPAMAAALADGDVDWAMSRLRRSILLSGVTVSIASLIVIAAGPWAIREWFGPALVPGRSLLIAMGCWSTYSVAMSQLSYLLSAAQIVRAQVVMATLMAAVNLPLSIYLAYRIGVTGPLIASLVSHTFFAGMPTVRLVLRLGQRGELHGN